MLEDPEEAITEAKVPLGLLLRIYITLVKFQTL